MSIDYSYMELIAKPETTNFETVSLDQLRQAIYRSAIHTFGWPIAAVIFTPDLEPKPIKGGIEARFTDPGHREYWSFKRTGEFYFHGELFENTRRAEAIFLDTRTNRIAETFMRVGGLYKVLGVPDNELIYIQIKHGNINGKVLAAANPARFFPVPKHCKVNEVGTQLSIPLQELNMLNTLKLYVYQTVRELAEMFEMFHPDQVTFTDPIVEAFVHGRIV